MNLLCILTALSVSATANSQAITHCTEYAHSKCTGSLITFYCKKNALMKLLPDPYCSLGGAFSPSPVIGDYSCPEDSKYRPCFRAHLIECKTDSDCTSSVDRIIKCCEDNCYEQSKICKPGVPLKRAP